MHDKIMFVSQQSAVRKARWSLAIIAFVLIAWFFQCNLGVIINKLDSFGMFTPVLFLLVYCLVSILCLPTILLVLAGGMLFGPLIGTMMSLSGATLGAACGFCISRYLRPDKFTFKEGVRLQKLMVQVERQGWKAVALLRLAPVIPFNLVNYGMGLTRIKFNHYIFATMIFLIPNKIIVTCSGYYGINFFDQTRVIYILQKMAGFFTS